MFGLLSVIGIVCTGYQLIKEAITPEIPAENWANMELYHKDIMSGMPIEERLKNVRNGRYKLIETHPKPHRDSRTGKIIIENCSLYNQDLQNYSVSQVYKWVEQGRYNLDGEALKQEQERIKKKYENLRKRVY